MNGRLGLDPEHVNWSEIPDEPVREGVRRRGFGNSDVLLVMNECHPGMALRPHSHHFDQIAMILSGNGIYHIGGRPHEISAGSIMLIPAETEHYVEPHGNEPVMNVDVFAPARGDYLHLLDWMSS